MQPVIYESEYNFCKILWENEPVKSTELVRLCREKLDWKKSTTYTVIKRLSDRGIIKSENAIVTSIIKKEDAQSIESVNTIDSRFDGSLPEFVAAFVRARGITDEERQEIVKLEDGTEKSIRIHEIHMEEDAGKLIHDEWEDVSYVDYNRSGVPLIEIVSEPDMRSAEEVIAYLTKLRTTIQYLGASDCKLQEGSMRADVNLSVRERGSSEFGTRTETKNLNSFAAIERAIKAETARQIDLIEAGEKVVQETRRWNDDKEYSYAMRSKEDAQDYRYFPDPDLVPIRISDEYLAELKAKQPEFKDEKKARYIEEFGLPEYDAEILTDSKKFTEIFEEATAICNQPKKVSNWIMGETMRLMKEESAKTGREFRAEELTFSPESLAKIITLVEKKEINNAAAKEIFEHVFAENVDVDAYVEEHGLKQVNDEGALRATVEKVIADNPQSVADYKGGKKQAIGYLVGQTMKAMQGKANPGMVNALLQELLK